MRRITLMTVGAALALSTSACGPRLRIRHFHDALTVEEHMQLGATYEQEGVPAQARRQYEAALKANRRFVPALMALGDSYFQAKDFRRASRYYARTLLVVPHYAPASNNLAMCYLASGHRLGRAEKLARRAVDGGEPYRPYALDTLANVLIAKREFAEAQSVLNQAQAYIPYADDSFRQNLKASQQRLQSSQSP